MSTRGVIAVSHDGETWQGRYHHWDSYPEGLGMALQPVSYTHLRAHETRHDLVCRLLLEKKKLTM